MELTKRKDREFWTKQDVAELLSSLNEKIESILREIRDNAISWHDDLIFYEKIKEKEEELQKIFKEMGQ